MNKVKDTNDDTEIRASKSTCGKIHPTETTIYVKKTKKPKKYHKRKGISFIGDKIEPIGSVCQVCYQLDGLFACKICKRFLCIRDTTTLNGVYFCEPCIINPEYSPYIFALYADENKITFMKKIKLVLIRAFSFEWLYKNE